MAKGKTRSFRTELARYQGNYIIPIMGPTGVGKSSFINQLLGADTVKVGHSLDSCTIDLQPVEIPAHMIQHYLPLWNPSNPARKLIVVDTPGFDDTAADDSDILKRIADWLAASYGAGARLSGVIYLQEITQARVTGATKRNFQVFDKLCGEGACKSVVLGTTKWKSLHADDIAVAGAREQELRNKFWKEMLGKGSKIQRVDDGVASPWNLVETVLYKGESPTLQIQREMVELKRSLPQTEAGRILKRSIEDLLKSLKKGGATKEEMRAFVNEVEVLKEKSFLGRFIGRFFG